MDNSNVIMGSDLMAFIGTKTIGFATSCSLELSGDATDIANKNKLYTLVIQFEKELLIWLIFSFPIHNINRQRN